MKIFRVIRGKHGRRREWRRQVAIERTNKVYLWQINNFQQFEIIFLKNYRNNVSFKS